MPVKPEAAVGLLIDETAHHILRLRELLVRGDENLAAWRLLDECVPYWAQDHPAIVQAKAEQYEMVRHALDPDWYEKYYASNPHERPFEEQYAPLTVETAHEGIPRFGILREWLYSQVYATRPPLILDMSSNDGAMAANLGLLGHTVHCLDLNPGCVERARARGLTAWQGNLNDPPADIPYRSYDAVVLFETIEHVPDPEATLKTCARYVRPGGSLYVSTPWGAVEGLDLPGWAHVESKGHLWAFTPDAFLALLRTVGTVDRIVAGPDNVLVAQVTPA